MIHWKTNRKMISILFTTVLMLTCVLNIALSICFLTKQCTEVNYTNKIEYSEVEFYMEIVPNDTQELQNEDELSRVSRIVNEKRGIDFGKPKYHHSEITVVCNPTCNVTNKLMSSNTNDVLNNNEIQIGDSMSITMVFAVILVTIIGITGVIFGFGCAMSAQTICLTPILCLTTCFTSCLKNIAIVIRKLFCVRKETNGINDK